MCEGICFTENGFDGSNRSLNDYKTANQFGRLIALDNNGKIAWFAAWGIHIFSRYVINTIVHDGIWLVPGYSRGKFSFMRAFAACDTKSPCRVLYSGSRPEP